MRLGEENCHAESMAGSKGSSARRQIVSDSATITLGEGGLYWVIDSIFEFQGYGLKIV